MQVTGMMMLHQANAPSIKKIFPKLFKRHRRGNVQEGETAFMSASLPVSACSNFTFTYNRVVSNGVIVKRQGANRVSMDTRYMKGVLLQLLLKQPAPGPDILQV